MVEPVPTSWPVYKLGYRYMVLSVGTHSSFVDAHKLEWCEHMFGSMGMMTWIDQGSWVCFVDASHAALYDMTWYS